MSSESQFPKLPNLTELLQHPTVEKVVGRLNQTTIAQRATGFLAELQSSLLETTEHLVPSLNLIAERFAVKLLDKSTHSTPIINATGKICTDNWNVPLADSALRKVLQTAGEFHKDHEAIYRSTLVALCEFTNAEAAIVLSSYQVATKIVQESDIEKVEYAGFAGIINPKNYGYLTVPSISDRLDSEADLVVCDGGGLIGGPRCGIVLGKEQSIRKLQQHPWAEIALANANLSITLAATLEIYRSPEQVMHHIPIWQLLSAPIENLQQRAERLSQLIEASELILSAEPLAAESVWYHSKLMQLASPTWVIKIQSVDSIISLLKQQSPQIHAREESGSVIFDLRSVFPRWDQALVEFFQTTQSANKTD